MSAPILYPHNRADRLDDMMLTHPENREMRARMLWFEGELQYFLPHARTSSPARESRPGVPPIVAGAAETSVSA